MFYLPHLFLCLSRFSLRLSVCVLVRFPMRSPQQMVVVPLNRKEKPNTEFVKSTDLICICTLGKESTPFGCASLFPMPSSVSLSG